MIDIPYDQALRRIHEETSLPLAELQSRVDAKLKQLGGLVSRDGAVHILANELGVQLGSVMSGAAQQAAGQDLKIAEVTLESRGISVTGRVVRKYEAKTFSKNGRDGRVASLLLGDETGVTRVVFWNDQVDVFEQLKDGDVLIVKNPFVKQSYMRDRIELQLNTQSTLVVNPEGVTVADRPGFAPGQPGGAQRPPREQKYLKDLQGGEENVEVIATIVQVYDPRFFDACPQCNKKLLGTSCPEHGEVAVPSINFSMSAFLDDGTGNIRTSFWKQQALRLTGKSEAEFLKYKDDPSAFEEIKNDLLGEFVKVVGRVKRNETFDRLELTANLVFTDVDPVAELETLNKKLAAERERQQSAPQERPAEGPMETVTVEEKTVIRKDEDSLTVVEDDVISLDELADVDDEKK